MADAEELVHRKSLIAVATVVALLAFVVGVRARFGNPDALWQIVHDRCVPDETDKHDPAPCIQVDLGQRWAVLKDAVGKTQFLLLATDRVTGIEDPKVLAPQAPNYFEAAWEARGFVVQRASHPLTNDQLSLAINSQVARSQNQLHIHVDCVRADVHEALHHIQGEFTTSWSPITVAGEQYSIRHLDKTDLQNKNLFALVAEQLQPGQGMDLETIVVIGAAASDQDGFDVLVGRAGVGGNKGGGEALQDHGCTTGKSAS
jgi:CDP-diacylglycerol pyrophosphatase